MWVPTNFARRRQLPTRTFDLWRAQNVSIRIASAKNVISLLVHRHRIDRWRTIFEPSPLRLIGVDDCPDGDGRMVLNGPIVIDYLVLHCAVTPMIADELRRQADQFVDIVALQPRISRDPVERAARELASRGICRNSYSAVQPRRAPVPTKKNLRAI